MSDQRSRGPLRPLLVPDRGAGVTARPARTAWQAQSDRVPSGWTDPSYVIDAEPYRQLFTLNANYRPGRCFDFGPAGHDRLRAETAWWLWTCWNEGLRKVEPSMLRWWAASIAAMADARTDLAGRRHPSTRTSARRSLAGATPALEHSIADFDPQLVIREAIRAFTARNGRIPSPGNRRNLASIAEHAHLYVSVRCSDQSWWEHNTWDLRVDDRIPRRRHEPAAHRPVRLGLIAPLWLREGVRFWLKTAITTELFRWSTATTRVTTMSAYFGPWVAAHGDTHPALTDTPGGLREAFTDFLAWLRSPAATQRASPLGPTQVCAVQDHVQGFYRFMVDNAQQAAAATSNPDWTQLTDTHARLWIAGPRARRRRPPAQLDRWVAAADMARMLSCLPILSAPTTEILTVTPPGQDPITSAGLGDPQAARAWMLQAMTGRRVSEILMIDYEPLTLIPGVDQAAAGPDDFVARLRYQQTKVDGVDPTIPVEASVMHLIREQQQYARARVPDGTTPPYLFLEPRHNHKGLRPRSYPSHQAALKRLDEVVALHDVDGRTLRFTTTHRLRHTKATDMLDAGVPVHVAQRYFGHSSPEMFMNYGATKDATAAAEFMKAKRAGAFGTPLKIDAVDLYEITALSGRTDRILPNGLCLLPPASTCDKGNACLTCSQFATDTTHLPELRAQHRATLELIDIRQGAFTARHGTPMSDTHVWLQQRQRELDSLEAITTALEVAADEPPTTTPEHTGHDTPATVANGAGHGCAGGAGRAAGHSTVTIGAGVIARHPQPPSTSTHEEEP